MESNLPVVMRSIMMTGGNNNGGRGMVEIAMVLVMVMKVMITTMVKMEV